MGKLICRGDALLNLAARNAGKRNRENTDWRKLFGKMGMKMASLFCCAFLLLFVLTACGDKNSAKVVFTTGLDKNQVFREAEVDIIYGEGISREGDILDLAANDNIVNKSGAWYSYNGSKIGQGRENAKIYLKEHPDVMAEVEQKVREKHINDIEEDEDNAAQKEAKEQPVPSIPDDIDKDIVMTTEEATI